MATSTIFKMQVNPTFRDMEGRFVRASERLLEDRRDQVRDLGRLLVRYMQDEAPRKTGDFADNIRFRTFRNGVSNLGFTISAPQPLDKWIRFGTKPHEIVPKGPGYPLAFYWERVGGMFYTYRVNHPGTKPNRYDERAIDKWQPEADETNAKISTRYVTMIAKGR